TDLAASGIADLDDDVAGGLGDLDATTESGVLAANDDDEATGRNLGLDDDDLDRLSASVEAADEATGRNPAVPQGAEDTDLDLAARLLEASGQTQVISDDEEATIGDDGQAMRARIDDEAYVAAAGLSSRDLDTEFDFAKPEA